MELRAETFNSLDDNFDLRQLISVRTANGLRIGRLPGSEFSANGVFVRNTYEIERLQCMALLMSGMILSIDGKMVVTITSQTASQCYMVVGFDGEMVEYESHGQLFVRPTYAAQLMTLEEIEAQEKDGNYVMPIVRFAIDGGRISVDPAYIPPCLIMASDERLSQHCTEITRMLESVAAHANLEDGDGKRTLLRDIFHLQRYNTRNTVEDFMQCLASVANALDYYIMRPNHPASESQNLPTYSQYDVEQWILWFKEYLKEVTATLDQVVLEDHSIDYEQLKADLRREILAVVQPEMNEQIEAVRERLNTELQTQISSVLKEYIDGTFRNHLHDELHDELHERLRQPMYDELYQALYDALYVPQQEEEETFMPLI